jgi:DNA-binding MarR family transcriptional regulator
LDLPDQEEEEMADEGGIPNERGDKWHEELVLPVLLAEGRATYGRAIREAHAEAGFDDIPRLGSRLLGGIRRFGGSVGSVSDVARDFGVSKQAASKLIDTLVIRGYLERRTDPTDRRRLMLELTERGRDAADAGWQATDRIDERLEEAVGADAVAQMRATVGALVALRERK